MKENSLSAYQGFEPRVATFYELPGIPPLKRPAYMVTLGYCSGSVEGQRVGPIIQPLFGMNSCITFGPVEADPATRASTLVDANSRDEAYRKKLHLLVFLLWLLFSTFQPRTS